MTPPSWPRSHSHTSFANWPRPSPIATGVEGDDKAFALDDDEPLFILDDDEAAFVVMASGVGIRRSASRVLRQRTVVFMASIVAMLMALAGPSPVVARSSAGSLPGAAQSSAASRLPLRDEVAFDAPVGLGGHYGLQVTAANGPQERAYACWMDQPRSVLRLALLDTRQLRWIAVTSPVASAARCDIVADSSAQQSAVLAVWAPPSGATGTLACALPTLFTTGDGGHTWRRLAWPASALPSCTARFALVAGRLYVSSDTPLLPATLSSTGALGRLIVTADAGRTWRAADTGMLASATFTVLAYRPGGRLLAQVTQSLPPQISALWESSDDGARWRALGTLPGIDPHVFVSSDPDQQMGGGWGRLYVNVASGAGSGDSLVSAELSSRVGLPLPAVSPPPLLWSAVSQPPVGTNGASSELWGLSMPPASEGPGQSLLALQTVPSSHSFIERPQFRIWDWNPATGQWATAQYTIPPNSLIQSVAWYGGHMQVWLTAYAGSFTARARVTTLVITL